jgi:hypothetical protein
MSITIPTTAQIGSTLERIARALAIAIAVTMAAGMVTIQAIENLSTLTAKLTSRPLSTLIDLIPETETVSPVKTTPFSVPILTGAEFMAMWNAEFIDDEPAPARKRPARRKPGPTARKVGGGA